MDSGVMNRDKRLVLLALLACVCAWAQPSTSIRIGTNANSLGVNQNGPIFVVDGQQFTSTQVFVWPVGSKHIVQYLLSVDPVSQAQLPYQSITGDVRYYF